MESITRSSINIEVELDPKKHPKTIFWRASDNPSNANQTECKAFLLSLFDANSLDTLKIDLWTDKMQVSEMDRFMFQTLKALADTYFKATNNVQLANAMQGFATYFGEETQIIPKSDVESMK
ncbi:MAG: gliding motility protein GldC [Saprospiraceae bacterium]|nr:gliding motility protein GldC [Saprospiraceae bacterium]